MSETEEPTTKVLKTEEENDMSDTTAVSNLTDVSMTTETLDLPETSLPEVTDLPEVPDLPEATDLPEITDLPEVSDLPEVAGLPAQQSLNMAENISMEAEMVEERLQDSVESEEAAESQEEWLSEGILTDEDFNPAVESAPDSQTSQPDTYKLVQSNTISNPVPTQSKPAEQNIEDALNTLEGGPEKDMSLDEFLIKKTNVNTETTDIKKENIKEEADDGNDTDDLLRMLGDDGSKTKKLTKTVKDVRSAAKEASSDDNEFVFQGTAKKIKLTKSLGKVPKTEPEDMDGTGQSSDESEVVQKMFHHKKSVNAKPNAKSVRYQETNAKSVVNVERPMKDKLATSTPLPVNKTRSLLKPSPLNTVQLKRELQHQTYTRKPQNIKSSAPAKVPTVTSAKDKKVETHEEYLDENLHSADEEFESDNSDDIQNHRRERMDASDGDSRSEDGSLYDELPSSESDDAEDWFQLDIRAEKAGDYLPLLGLKAKQLLLEEKKRVAARLDNLKQSLSALTDSGKKQAEEVLSSTIALAELDDMLKAS